MQKEVLLFLKAKLSESKLDLSLKFKLIDEPQNLYTSFEELKSLRG